MKQLNKKAFFKDFKKRLFENFNIKIICLILAIATYFFVGVFQKNEKTFTCKLNIVGLKDFLSIENELPESVKVIAKDKQKVLDKITETDFEIRIDMSDIETPDNYDVDVKWKLPKNMKSFFSNVEIIPSKFKLSVEKLVEKNIPVVVNYSGTLDSGLLLKKTIVNPTEIRIQGPEKLVDKVKFIETERINIQGEVQSFYRDVNIVIPYKNIKTIGRDKVEVYFEIIRETENLTLRFDTFYYDNLNNNFKLIHEKNPVFVKVGGMKNSLSKLSKDNIVLMADCTTIVEEGTYSLDYDVILPKGIELISIIPESIKVKAELKVQ